MNGADRLALNRAQVEIEMSVFIGEARQAVKIVDFPSGQNQQTAHMLARVLFPDNSSSGGIKVQYSIGPTPGKRTGVAKAEGIL
jgi:hypothetical protein